MGANRLTSAFFVGARMSDVRRVPATPAVRSAAAVRTALERTCGLGEVMMVVVVVVVVRGRECVCV